LDHKFFLQSSFWILQEHLFLLMSFFRLLMRCIEVSKQFASVFRDSSLDPEKFMFTKYVLLAIRILEWMSIHILFPFFLELIPSVKLSTHSNLKS
jgi:hypothetical protein